jgi:hypothetical protein
LKNLLFLLILLPFASAAQQAFLKPRTVPVGLANYQKDEHYLKLTYGRPSMIDDMKSPFGRGRIAWQKLWRMGDDDATELTTTTDVLFCGDTLRAGTYSLFSIPDTANWTLIVNSKLGLWGTYKYDSAYDVLRAVLPVYDSPQVAMQLTFYIEPTKGGADIVMLYDQLAIRMPVLWLEEED